MIARRRQAALNVVSFGIAALAGWVIFHPPHAAHQRIAATAPNVNPTIAIMANAR